MSTIDLTADELNMIQTLRNQKAQNQGADSTHSNEGGNSNSKPRGEKPKRTYRMQPVYKVLGKAKRLFLKQVSKDIKAKAACMQTALDSYDNLYPDKLRFELDFRAERERLTDSNRFCRSCEQLGLNPIYVADNVLFEGKTVLGKVLKDGLQVVGENVHMFNAPLWKDSQNLYKEQVAEQDETKKEGGDE